MSTKHIPDSLDLNSEEDLRILVSNYLKELGFDRNELSFEDYFCIRLGRSEITVEPDEDFNNKQGGRSDILVSRNGKPLAILELKNPDSNLTEDDAKQAISYARLLDQIAPFAILTNGHNTKVFDVIMPNLTEIEDPQESSWVKNNQKFMGITDELKYEASKILIGVNHDTLTNFCNTQIKNSMADLKSDIEANKKYIPDIYVERKELMNAYEKWEQNNNPIFAVVSPSGFGKTNFMCYVAENNQFTNYRLFYSASRIRKDFISEVIEDFFWEFHREKSVVHIFDRFDSISRETGQPLHIYIDGIDEYRHGLDEIKNELIAITKILSRYENIRLIVSCKNYDWPRLIIDDNQSFNLIAEAINPSCIKQENITRPNHERVGFHLKEFSDEEFEEAITKYRSAYKFKGEFKGDLRKECHNPLLLRFISEVYAGKSEEIPADITSKELFDLYLDRKLSYLDYQNSAKKILIKISHLLFDSGNRAIDKDELLLEIDWTKSSEESFEDLLRLGVIFSSEERDGLVLIGFEFHKFLLYFYIFHALKFHKMSSNEQIQEIYKMKDNTLGIELIGQYFVLEKSSKISELLLNLATNDIKLVGQFLNSIDVIKSYRKTPIPLDHIINYLTFYNGIRSNLFSEQFEKLMPYSSNPLGVMFIGKNALKFRGCTESYPEPVVEINNPDLIKSFFNGNINQMILHDLDPVGTTYIGASHNFDEYPQKAAFEHITQEVGKIFSHRLLDESQSDEIQRERIYEVLTGKPTIWPQGDDLPHKHYWELIGYDNLDKLSNSKIRDILDRTKQLIAEFKEKEKPSLGLQNVYKMRLRDLYSLAYSLSQMDLEEKLGERDFPIEELYSVTDNIERIAMNDILIRFFHKVLTTYQTFFQANFPDIAPNAPFYLHVDKCSLIEIIRPCENFHTDYVAVSYIVFPSEGSDIDPKVIGVDYEQSLTKYLHFEGLFGEGYSTSFDQGFGYVQIEKTLSGERYQEKKAWAIKTKFPSKTPLLDQVYQMLGYELSYLLETDRFNWNDIAHGEYKSNRYLKKSLIYLMDHGILDIESSQ